MVGHCLDRCTEEFLPLIQCERWCEEHRNLVLEENADRCRIGKGVIVTDRSIAQAEF